jgi:hypothetical protein
MPWARTGLCADPLHVEQKYIRPHSPGSLRIQLLVQSAGRTAVTQQRDRYPVLC